ncbi:hypothetical protein AVEN_57708-1 [Araneus ventricosus]|uniref:Uncharacterized protein n=1 Tax=Araneus ventricosus TaxID=182803 RepID=A0A4Y2WAC7_ARAVE|nr:hypothetical protein AVEN_57708-1 [Araneus ventricosus]
MSSLETLCHPHFQMHPVAVEILGLLQTLQHRGFCILFCWIPSHVGIIGNEQADHSAKTAASFLHPYCDVKKSVASHIYSLWQEIWDLQGHNKLYYIKPCIGLQPALPIRGADVKLTSLHTRFTHKHLLFGTFPTTRTYLKTRDPLRGTSSLGVTGFTTPRYPSVCSPF